MAERFSDEKLAQFYREFQEHVKPEEEVKEQQREIYDALFRKADPDTNISPGLIQLTTQVDARLRAMEITNDRQKRFIGGFLFAFTCVGFFFTDSAHKLMSFFRSL